MQKKNTTLTPTDEHSDAGKDDFFSKYWDARIALADSDSQHEISGLTVDGFKEALTLIGADVRFDTRANTGSLMLSPLDGWQQLTGLRRAKLQSEIERRCLYRTGPEGSPRAARFSRERFGLFLDVLMHDNSTDPFMDWILARSVRLGGSSDDSRPEIVWDGVKRVDGLIDELWGKPKNDDAAELQRWASRAIFVGVIQRTFEPGCALDESVVLVGEGGAGKSKFLESLIPDRWFQSGLDLCADDKSLVEALQGVALVEAAEMRGASRSDLARLKAFLTRRDDKIRLAYRRDSESMPRRCVIVGTANPGDMLPNDAAALRRLVPVELQSARSCIGRVEPFIGAIRDQLWAEAWFLYTHEGARANLPEHLLSVGAGAADSRRTRDEVSEELIAGLNPGAYGTLRDIAIAAGVAEASGTTRIDASMQARLCRALIAEGWESTGRKETRIGRRARYWYGPEFNPNSPTLVGDH